MVKERLSCCDAMSMQGAVAMRMATSMQARAMVLSPLTPAYSQHLEMETVILKQKEAQGLRIMKVRPWI